jgi:hypothetical protein
MSVYIAACEEIRQAFNCAVVIIHHCGIDGTRPRGHTSLTGAVDAQIAIRRDGPTTIAKIEFMKDGEEGDEIYSRLQTVVVGTDEDGEEITSCVVEETEAVRREKPLSPSKLAAVNILETLCDLSPKQETTYDEWREACVRSSLVSDANTRRARVERFRRLSQELVDDGIVVRDQENVRLNDEL